MQSDFALFSTVTNQLRFRLEEVQEFMQNIVQVQIPAMNDEISRSRSYNLQN